MWTYAQCSTHLFDENVEMNLLIVLFTLFHEFVAPTGHWQVCLNMETTWLFGKTVCYSSAYVQ